MPAHHHSVEWEKLGLGRGPDHKQHSKLKARLSTKAIDDINLRTQLLKQELGIEDPPTTSDLTEKPEV